MTELKAAKRQAFGRLPKLIDTTPRESFSVRVVGLDVSLRNFGCVIADVDIYSPNLDFEIVEMHLVSSEDGAKKAKTMRKNSDDLNRAKLLFEGLQMVCEDASFAFAEMPVGSQSARAMASYGICVGVLSSCPIPMIEVTAAEVKLAGTGIKTATKGEMIEAAVKEHPEGEWLTRKVKGEIALLAANEHLADACFAIKAGLKTMEFRTAMNMLKAARRAA